MSTAASSDAAVTSSAAGRAPRAEVTRMSPEVTDRSRLAVLLAVPGGAGEDVPDGAVVAGAPRAGGTEVRT